MLGVIIGVASVVALVGVGQGTTSNITNRLSSLGTNLLTVSPTGQRTRRHGDPHRSTTATRSRNSTASPPSRPKSRPRCWSPPATRTRRRRSSARPPPIRGSAPTTSGRAPSSPTSASSAGLRVAVLGATTATNLGLGAADLGSTVPIGGIPFEVIGILQPKGGSGLPGPRRPGPRAGRRRAEVLRRRRRRAHDRRQRRRRPT